MLLHPRFLTNHSLRDLYLLNIGARQHILHEAKVRKLDKKHHQNLLRTKSADEHEPNVFVKLIKALRSEAA